MHRKRLMPEICPFCGLNHYTRDLVVVDIDGTLCRHVEPCDPEGFRCAEPLPERIAMVRHVKEMGHNVILMTGRPEVGREATEAWLDEHGVPHDGLFMEKSGYVFVIDDKPVIASWEAVERNDNDPEERLRRVLDGARRMAFSEE